MITNRRRLVLAMLLLAMDELRVREESLDLETLMPLVLVYGAGIGIEEWEVKPFFEAPLLEALA